MRRFSLGGSLVLRQVLFLILLIALGVVAIVNAETILSLARSLAGAKLDSAKILTTDLVTACQHMLDTLFVGLGLACFIILGVSAPAMHRTIARPIQRLAKQMKDLAEGHVDARIDGMERKDEIGDIARSLGVLREAVKRRGELAAELEKRDDREARLAHEVGIRAKIEQFGRDLAGTTENLSAMTLRMRDASEAMIGASGRAAEGSSHAKTFSAHAAADVSSVALASEQLLSSIEEINTQVVQSTSVIKKAVEEARASSAGMSRLSAAAGRVGAVVNLISRIAAQTNLLALNATIEAARAGEAGRGFAVVAQEVKALATQTAKATQDIAEQIAEMQSATDVSVAAIEVIQTKISEVERISTIIAAAVHEQGASTHEIARNVRSAAGGAASMSSHVENVEAAIHETGSGLQTVAGLAHDLEEMARGMSASVSGFAGVLKAA